MATLKDRYGRLVIPWSHVNQVLAAIQVSPRSTADDLAFSKLVEPNVNVDRMLDQLVRTGKVTEYKERVGPPTYTLAFAARKILVPVEGDSVPSQILRIIKQDPGLSARGIGLRMNYANPGPAVAKALQQLTGTGQVRKVTTRVKHEYYATGAGE